MMQNAQFVFSLDVNNKFVVYRHTGLLTIDEIVLALQKLIGIREFLSAGYNLLTDFSHAEFDFKYDNANSGWEFFEANQKIFMNKKGAIVTSTPVPTAYSMMFELDSFKKFGYQVKVFSTEEAAVKWLSINQS